MLSAYSIVANDAIQTLGTFLSSNAKRPWWILWIFACTILTAVFLYGWFNYNGDISYGRLSKFPTPNPFTWIYIIPPIALLFLTNFGIPVSTTFLILTVFNPDNLTSMLTQSFLGYISAFMVSMLLYSLITKNIEKQFSETSNQKQETYWTVLQWCSTAFLWSQWLIQDLANIFAYLPRQLNLSWLIFALAIMLILHAIIFYRSGGTIQQIVTNKTNTYDIRSATIIDFIYGLILFLFKEYSKIPMSTTWVFIGLLAGREIAISSQLEIRPMKDTGIIIINDGVKALIGLGISVILAFGLPLLEKVIS